MRFNRTSESRRHHHCVTINGLVIMQLLIAALSLASVNACAQSDEDRHTFKHPKATSAHGHMAEADASVEGNNDDSRQKVVMPEMMRQHMLTNMRDHLKAVHEIMQYISEENYTEAAEVAETRLGMSSLQSHQAEHMAKVMPQAMAQIGQSMHKAASQFALKVEEGDNKAALKALTGVSAACVACHDGYRVH